MAQDFDPPRGTFDHGYPYWQKETMALKPIGHRVLIKPDEAPTASAGGLVLPDEHDHVSMSGTVIAVGKGSRHMAEVRERTARKCLALIADMHSRRAVERYINTLVSEPIHTVAVGDRVAYSAESGAIFTEDGQQYLVLNEDDVVVFVEESEAVA